MRKLEIGSGPAPVAGYEHLDIDPAFPHLEYVCDISNQKLPLADETFHEILMSHVIEHIPWRKLPHVVKELYRVLKPGGQILLRTPDLQFIVERYIRGKTTPEHPGDEAAMREVFGTLGPSQWAIIKLFSGQDYLSNFHYVCFDRQSLEQLFLHHGFASVDKYAFEREISPGELAVKITK